MKTRSNALGAVLTLALASAFAPVAMAQESLPFPPNPSGSTAARTMQELTYHPLPVPKRLPADAPNILIILIDDAGPALPSTYGGDDQHADARAASQTPVSAFNRFHTTAMCSPTRAALLTGRNHHRVGVRPDRRAGQRLGRLLGRHAQTAGASIAKVLGYYGYATAAFGKWHNTPPHQTTRRWARSTRWPTGRLVGFDYFYGFLAGETSQWEPALVREHNRDRDRRTARNTT